MSKIKSGNTKPEMIVRRYLHGNGFRYKLHDKTLPGKPDIVLTKSRIAIFVNGCFWHGHDGCKYFKVPGTRSEWWAAKLKGNVEKDRSNYFLLKKARWKVIEVWECDLKKGKSDKTLSKLLKQISNI